MKNKYELINHSFNEILCGDLIYDSYLRFRIKPTVNIRDKTLIFYIYDCYKQIEYFTNLAKEKEIANFYTIYTTYISNGIPTRVFIKHNIKVFSVFKISNDLYRKKK